MEDVNTFYQDNYGRMLAYSMHGGQWDMDVAKEVVSRCYIYHATHPDKYDVKWWRNKVVQQRSNIMRDENTYIANVNRYEEMVSIEETSVVAERWELLHSIDKRIDMVKNIKHRVILKEILIQGVAIGVASRRMVLKRFKDKVIKEMGYEL